MPLLSTAQPGTGTMFDFASKMLNTIMGTGEGQQGPGTGIPGQQQHFGMQQQQSRPLDGGYPQSRPSGQAPGVRPYGAPTFSGPRPNPGVVRGGPPAFGGPPRPMMSGPGTPHRFNNGPQPLPRGMQPLQGQGLGQGQGLQMQFRGPSTAPPSMGVSGSPGIMGQQGQQGQQQGLGMRLQRPQQQPRQPFQQQKAQAHLPPPGGGSSGGPVPDLDLSHLSAEERAMIENVMAKAQQLEQEAPPLQPPQGGPIRRPEDHQRLIGTMGGGSGMPGGDFGGGRLCPLCRQRDISGRDGHPPQECAECRNLVCNRCGGIATHPETKRPEWTCGNCIKRRRIIAAGGNQMGQGQVIAQHPGPYGGQTKAMGPGGQGDWESGRRGSGGSIGMSQLQGGSNQHRNWTDDRDSFESEAALDDAVSVGESDRLRHSPPLDLDLNSSFAHSSHSCITPPSQSQSMSTTSIPASASIAKPSCVQLPSRSISLEYYEDETDMGSTYNGHKHSSSPPSISTVDSAVSIPPTTPEESALMMEFTKLQSAVESYGIKRRGGGDYEQANSSEPPKSPPSPKISPQKSFESLSPLPSPISLIQSPGDSPISPDSNFPQPRKAIVVQEYELDNEYKSSSDEASETDSDDEEERIVQAPSESTTTGFYDHSPGEVYTIPEEEEEGGSPTGGDLVSSLSRPGMQDMGSPRRRMMGQECLPGQMMPPEHRQGSRPQLRPQRSLDNRILTSSFPLANHQTGDKIPGQMDQIHGNFNNPANAHAQNQMDTGGMMTQVQHHDPHFQHPTHEGQFEPGQLPQSYGQPQFSQPQGTIGSGSQQPQMQQSQHQMPLGQTLGQNIGIQQKGNENLNQWNANANLSGQGQGQQPQTGPMSQQNMTQDSLIGGLPSQFQSYQPQGSSTSSAIHPSLQNQQTANQQLSQQHQIPQSLGQQQQFSPQQQPAQYTSHPPVQDPQQYPQNFQTPQPQQNQQIQLQQQQQQQLQQQQAFLQQQLHYQQQQTQLPPSSQAQQFPGLGTQVPELSGYGTDQWSGQGLGQDINSQNQNLPSSQFSQNQQQNLVHQQQYQQQQVNTQLQQGAHAQQMGSLGMQVQQANPQLGPQQGGPGGNKSISGLLADFSRALGLGSTSPRPSPSDEKSEPFPSGMPGQDQSLSPYEPYFQPQGSTTLSGQYQPSFYPSAQPHSQLPQSSAFAPIQDLSQMNQMFIPQTIRGQSNLQQQYPYQNQPTSTQQQQLVTQFGTSAAQSRIPIPIHSPTTHNVQQQQQYAFQPQVLTQAGMMTQQQAQSMGVGALSPAQAQMYQQQMALQHQAQHLKKTSRRAHLTGMGDMRRDGTVLIPGQNLSVGPGGMTIGALTPAVVTSLGTFIGGGPAILTSSLLQQPLALTPLGTPVGTPRSGRDAGDSSDTMSETDSQKSLRMRRKLPCLPPDQEAAPLPSTKKRDRERAMEFRSLSPIRTSFDTSSVKSYPLPTLGLSRPSASESNLRKMVSMVAPDHTPRPGSALGLLQGSSVVSSISGKMDSVYPLCGNLFSTSSVFPSSRLRTTASGLPSTGGDFTAATSGLYSTYKTPDNWSANMAELAACLPPDLRHLLNKDPELGDLSTLASSLGDAGLSSNTQLPTFMKAIREQLQEERRQLLREERRRLEALRERDRELGARVDAVTGRGSGSDSFQCRAESSRTVGLSRSAGASPLMSRKLKGHQRQLSDPKLSLPFSPIEEDGELQDFDRGPGILKYKSYNAYGSLDDVLGGDWDHSQSYLASSWAAAGGVLRETAINNMASSGRDENEELRLQSSRYMPRRNSDGESWPLLSSAGRPTSSHHRRHHLRKHRKSRSWNPSPYVSEEEEEEDLSREEKKARIKAEIARRRQQLQERAGLHQELVRISRLREGPDTEKHSVLKSVDQLLRDQYSYHDPVTSYGGRTLTRHGPSGLVISPCASEEDKSIELIASTFRSDDYTSLLYEKLGEMSPMADSELGSELGNMAAMPLLEDMPTRSRRLLEDLHRSEMMVGYSGSGNLKGKYDVSNTQGLTHTSYRNVL